MNDRRKNNPILESQAIAKGLKRRKQDKFNDLFYISLVTTLCVILMFFFIGSFFIK